MTPVIAASDQTGAPRVDPFTLRTVTGEVMRGLREATGKQQLTIAQEMGLPRQYVSVVECGGRRLDSEMVLRLLAHYGVGFATYLRLVADRLDGGPASPGVTYPAPMIEDTTT